MWMHGGGISEDGLPQSLHMQHVSRTSVHAPLMHQWNYVPYAYIHSGQVWNIKKLLHSPKKKVLV